MRIADIAYCLVIAVSAFYAGYWRGRVVEHGLWMKSYTESNKDHAA